MDEPLKSSLDNPTASEPDMSDNYTERPTDDLNFQSLKINDPSPGSELHPADNSSPASSSVGGGGSSTGHTPIESNPNHHQPKQLSFTPLNQHPIPPPMAIPPQGHPAGNQDGIPPFNPHLISPQLAQQQAIYHQQLLQVRVRA